MVSQAIITSLLMRERFGIGQHIHTSILGSTLYLQYINVLNALWRKQEVPRHQRSHTYPLRNHYRCQDGKWISIGFPGHWEHMWPSFCQALEQPELQNNPKFNTLEKRFDNSEELISILDRIFVTKPRDKWLEIFAPYDLISCAVNTSLDLERDTQVIENDYIVDFDDPELGKVKIPGFPIQFSQTSAKTRTFAPSLGEHTMEILRSIGEYTDKEIARLKEEGVI
jgi:crotonobetainyl-CoA:carnitine CoA-transferase CaiB-like acyl-CoA transferase